MIKLHSVKLLTLLFLVLCSYRCQKKEPLILATYTYSTNDRIDNLLPLSKDLEKQLNRKVEVRSYPDVPSFIRGIKAKEVDIALINTLGYLILSTDNDVMHPIATLKVTENAVDNYKSVLLGNTDSITDLKDLVGQVENLRMTFVAQGSTSGNLMPRLLLSSLGIKNPEADFESVSYGGDHTKTFNKLLSNETDIAAIGSSEFYKQIASKPGADSLKVLWLSDEIPLGPVLLNNDLADTDREKISKVFLTLHQKAPHSLEAVKNGWSEAKQTDRFYQIDDGYYQNFRTLKGNSTDLPNILKSFE
ncbi:phosphate/phosphite/phosphonate ABC transporter substrate-binding protein [Flagellimonas allohymeniacidonis]|uniref:Phosphate/phosphite/phosphonate ABC transporter substrate-binding protein n=1 Tax=Flagellimonas allohymeniacidonis TaxID=2517819 RepID=A0A4Q8QFP1_9FLAO|nr:phosphate/phosphite/phosphonate ABC transporter substrate-binding protein [Allomuricauda hymeniacidonis]TAI46916.1 phosphate/phosphite/phosphonate ABC transporter substrate-binding protein [Allomuricauda hymeniacidonis]